MALDATHFWGQILDTKEAVWALNPYGSISSWYEKNSLQKEYFDNLESAIQSKVETLSAYLYKRQDLLDAITYQIEQGNTFNAETMMMQIVESIKRVKKDETKMEYFEAIHDLIEILKLSNFGDQIDATRNRVKEVLEWEQQERLAA